MINYLVQSALSNACIGLLLALIAMLVSAKANRPRLAHALWLLVFVKLLTPPLFNFPLGFLDENGSITANMAAFDPSSTPADFYSPMAGNSPTPAPRSVAARVNVLWKSLLPSFTILWIAGFAVVVFVSIRRAFQFNSLLNGNSIPASGGLLETAEQIAKQLGLKKLPDIRVTSANVSPLVWWIFGRVRVVLPESLLGQMGNEQWRLVLAHELAHVQRRDYLVRWLEWLGVTVFWWNPIVWWAQQNLRAAEEICCDTTVLSRLKPDPHTYANSILSAVEFLVRPAFRPPAMASEINSGGFLERRFEMIMSSNADNQFSLVSQLMVCSLVLLVIPFGLVQAQDYEKVEKRLDKSVEKGQLTEGQAAAMMETLKHMSDTQQLQIESEFRLRDMTREVQAAIESGEMTIEEGRQRINTIEKRIGKNENTHSKMRLDEKALEGMMRRLEQAAKRGEVTNEELGIAMARLKKRFALQRLEQDSKKAQLAVEKDKLSREDAKRRLIEIREEMAAIHAGRNRKMEEIAKRLKRAVESGDITDEEATKKWIGILLKQAEAKTNHAIEQGEISEEDARLRMNEYQRKLEVEHRERNNSNNKMEEMAQRLKMAVKSGEMSEDDAHANWDSVLERKRASEERQQLQMKILHAVAEGELTKEAAHQKIEAIRREYYQLDDTLHQHDDVPHEHDEEDHDEPHGHDDDLAVFNFYLGTSR